MSTVLCPNCNRPLITKSGKFGAFLACPGYPLCKHTQKIVSSPKIESPKIQPQKTVKNWSVYQTAIFTACKETKDNMIISAVAGSGKTTTIIESIKYLSGTIVFLAFNKNAANNIAEKISSESLCTVSTLHAIGLKQIKRVYPKIIVENNKNRLILNNQYGMLAEDRKKSLLNPICKLVSSIKAELSDLNNETLIKLCDKYGIELDTDIIDAAKFVYQESIKSTTMIDFDDMIFYPANGIVPVAKFDNALIDESQDLNPAQIALSLKIANRIIAVGDRKQAIYGWRGAMSDSMDYIKSALNAAEFPLSVSYRVPDYIAELVHNIPGFESVQFETIHKQNCVTNEEYTTCGKFIESAIEDNSLILCRNNAPMVKPVYTLLSRGVKVTIRGKDIGQGLITLIGKAMKGDTTDNLGDMLEGLNRYASKEIEKLEKYNQTQKIETLNDQISTIEALTEGLNSLDELYSKIDSIFSDDISPVVFSTIHRAKGDESSNVYILYPELIPSKYAKNEESLNQEYNLYHVAITRTLDKLTFIAK